MGEILKLIVNGGIAIVVIILIIQLVKVLRNGINTKLGQLVDELAKANLSHLQQENYLSIIKDEIKKLKKE